MMETVPHSLPMPLEATNVLMGLGSMVQPQDARLKPQAPMERLPVDLPEMGRYYGYVLTEQSHPDFMREYTAMALRAGFLHPPALVLVDTPVENAMALLKHDKVFVTNAMFEMLTMDEALSIIGHELGHLSKESKHGLLSNLHRFSGYVLSGLIELFVIPKLFREKDSYVKRISKEIGLSALALTPGIAVANLTTRPVEFEADRLGVQFSQRPEALISALEKIQHGDRSLLSKVGSIFAGYPTLDQRIAQIRRVAAREHVAEQPTPVISSATLTEPAAEQSKLAERSVA